MTLWWRTQKPGRPGCRCKAFQSEPTSAWRYPGRKKGRELLFVEVHGDEKRLGRHRFSPYRPVLYQRRHLVVEGR